MEKMKRIRCNSDGSIVIKRMNNYVTVIGRSLTFADHRLAMHKYDYEKSEIEGLMEMIDFSYEENGTDIENEK